MIKVEDAISNLKNQMMRFAEGTEPDLALQMAIEAIEDRRWIPVTERLPKENGRYLVTRGLNACDSVWNRTYILNYSDLMGLKSDRIWWDGNVGKSDFERFDDVIAWMPLPKQYKKGAEEV